MPKAAARKTTGKSTGRRKAPGRKPAKIPQPHGGALNAGGTPGNKGGTGRPPNEHIEYCRELLSDPACEAEAKAVLTDRFHGAFAAMWKAVAERGYGKAAQPHTGEGGTGPITHAVTVTRRLVRPGDE